MRYVVKDENAFIFEAKREIRIFITLTFTLIFKDTFARYCLETFNTYLVRQHCEINPKSVSQMRFRSPTKMEQKFQSCMISTISNYLLASEPNSQDL